MTDVRWDRYPSVRVDAAYVREHDDPNLLRVTAEIPMTEAQRLLNKGQRDAAARALEAAREVPPPVPPSVAFLTNPAGLSDTRLKELAESCDRRRTRN